MWGSFNKGELDAPGAPHPFLGCWDIGAYRLLEERIVHGWLRKSDGLNHGLTKFDGGSPGDSGGTHSPS